LSRLAALSDASVAHVVQLIHVVSTLFRSMWQPSFAFVDLDVDMCARDIEWLLSSTPFDTATCVDAIDGILLFVCHIWVYAQL
jgi:hypothetical protein